MSVFISAPISLSMRPRTGRRRESLFQASRSGIGVRPTDRRGALPNRKIFLPAAPRFPRSSTGRLKIRPSIQTSCWNSPQQLNGLSCRSAARFHSANLIRFAICFRRCGVFTEQHKRNQRNQIREYLEPNRRNTAQSRYNLRHVCDSAGKAEKECCP